MKDDLLTNISINTGKLKKPRISKKSHSTKERGLVSITRNQLLEYLSDGKRDNNDLFFYNKSIESYEKVLGYNWCYVPTAVGLSIYNTDFYIQR